MNRDRCTGRLMGVLLFTVAVLFAFARGRGLVAVTRDLFKSVQKGDLAGSLVAAQKEKIPNRGRDRSENSSHMSRNFRTSPGGVSGWLVDLGLRVSGN